MTTTVEREPVRYRALQERTLCAAFQATAADFPERAALRTRGDAFSITWGEYADRVRRVAAGLAGLGVERGKTIALMLNNRPEFHIVDAAAMHLGATPFSIYNTYAPEQIEYLVGDAQNTVIVTEPAYLDRVMAARDACSALEHVVDVDGSGRDGTITLDELARRAPENFDFEAAWRAVEPDDVLTLIYTSGTTGPPKGVQITHGNILAAGRSANEIIEFPPESRLVSYLPMAHIAERACSHYLPILFAATVTSCPNPREVVAYLPEVRPTWFFSVPRIYEKLKSAIEAGAAAEESGATRRAIELGLRKVRAEQAGEQLDDELRAEWERADREILSQMRRNLGFDQLHALNVGAAPTPYEVVEFFHALGLPLAELWGLSETTGAGTCNRPDRIKIGTVGPPSPGVEVKLADDGEVLVRSKVNMKGYRNDADKTRETIDADGWLHTGDIGEFDDEGFLTIVDRKKELIINAAGKNMSPANIEAKLKVSSDLVGQAICIGDARPYNVALITLDPDFAPYFAQQQGIEDTALAALASHPKVVEAVAAGVERANEQLARVEQIKKFTILPADWEPGGDELTPTMKLKRKPIAQKYVDEIEALYA
jgi:long-chain acyl-CoA synthetase